MAGSSQSSALLGHRSDPTGRSSHASNGIVKLHIPPGLHSQDHTVNASVCVEGKDRAHYRSTDGPDDASEGPPARKETQCESEATKASRQSELERK